MNEMSRPSGLYVHIPFCDGKCGYCAFYSVPYEAALADRLLAALEMELRLAADAGIAPAAETVYVGGGTPSILSPAQLERLGGMLRPFVLPEECSAQRDGNRHVPRPVQSMTRVPGIAATALPGAGSPQPRQRRSERSPLDGIDAGAAPREWSVEINPGSMSGEKLAVLVRAGVNRLSLGAQSFDDRVLKALGRRHSAEEIVRAVALIREAGVENFGLDLMAGIPGFEAAVWRHTLDQTVAQDPRHVSVYALSDEEGTRLNDAIRRGESKLLSDDEQLASLSTAEAVLAAAGYARYEISNYAKPGFECRHHCACWRGGAYLGIGPAAASHVGWRRWTNLPDLAGYLAALERGRLPPRDQDPLTPALKAMERVIFGLRLAEGIDATIAAGCLPALRRLKNAGLVDHRGRRWRLTARGRNLADAVAVELIPGTNPEK